jgi:hypothetical protein
MQDETGSTRCSGLECDEVIEYRGAGVVEPPKAFNGIPYQKAEGAVVKNIVAMVCLTCGVSFEADDPMDKPRCLTCEQLAEDQVREPPYLRAKKIAQRATQRATQQRQAAVDDACDVADEARDVVAVVAKVKEDVPVQSSAHGGARKYSSSQEAAVVSLAMPGKMSYGEIGASLQPSLTAKQVKVLVERARRKGVAVPKQVSGRRAAAEPPGDALPEKRKPKRRAYSCSICRGGDPKEHNRPWTCSDCRKGIDATEAKLRRVAASDAVAVVPAQTPQMRVSTTSSLDREFTSARQVADALVGLSPTSVVRVLEFVLGGLAASGVLVSVRQETIACPKA